ncbi:MAG: tetratricopeptide repeat protein [Alphaproteobacteria bacterium]|nr:tetratricopeptide repeat protein [Alphaproteobacteria bacterium]
MERRLAAILAIDMVGYSRLMGGDEAGTLAAIQQHRRELMTPRAAQYNGRVIKLIGDGALMEFASVVDAVCFAVEVQLALRDQNAGLPEDRQYLYRIGINVGDVIIQDDDIYGDGVNIAARLEGVADAGGICLSGSAFDQVKGKLDLTFEPLGERRVKNIAEPVTPYRVLLDKKAAALATPLVLKTRGLLSSRRGLAAVAAVLLLAVAGAAFWWRPWAPPQEPAGLERFAYPLPDKPSIAVLPFINVSGEAEHDHFAEGLTDDLITELSKVSGLFVIARHSVFSVQGSAAKIQDVAAELGVHYVLEGSLRQAGLRLRINVTLIDALSGLSLWAERYDREYTDLFAVQDDVVSKIIGALSIKLTEGERDLLARIPTDNLEAYDNYLRAEQEGFYYSDVETYRRTLTYYQRAIDLDPGFADAHAGIARVAVDVWRNDYDFLWSAAVARKIAYDAAGQALKLDPENARAHIVLALLQLVDGRPVEATQSARMAVAVQPNNPEAHGNLALVQVHTGEADQAVAELEKALRLDPAPPPSLQLLAGVVLHLAQDYERAIPLLEAARDALPKAEPAREFLAAAYAHAGERDRAAQEAAHLLQMFPESNLTYYGYIYDFWREQDRNRHLDGLRKAGITLWPFGFEGQEADRLDAEQLGALIRDTSWTGAHQNGTKFMQFFDQAGNTAYRSANTNITGTVRVRDGQLCQRFDGYLLGRSTCGYIYRNVNGEAATGDQAAADYVHVTPGALKFFSLDKP